MNATSLYVSTSRLVFQSECTSSDQSWTDLFRLVPYLRQSLSCTVCGHLLIEPYTPVDAQCQHHVCRLCVRGRKNLKPTCNCCNKEYEKYEENVQLRILLQCYKSLCEYIMTTPMYSIICKQSKNATTLINNGGSCIPSASLVEFIEEGAKFQDNFKSNAGLTKSALSMLPCVFNNPPPPAPIQQQQQSQLQQQNHHQQQQQKITAVNKNSCLTISNQQPILNNVIKSVPVVEQQQLQQQEQQHLQQHLHQQQQQQQQQQKIINQPPPIKTVSNGSAMYSVLYTGIGNKITIKRKTDGDDDYAGRKYQQITVQRPKQVSKRRGCRCGNATATPGKLTCCGQRCPCYVESKSCIDCKCRGCRNPHRPDGGKVRPIIPELACYEIQVADDSTNLSTMTGTNCLEIPLNDLSTTARLGTIKNQPGLSFTNHQIRQPTVSLDSINREPLLISSQEGNFQVLNVFTSPPQATTLQQQQQTHNPHTQLTINQHSRNHHTHHHQIPEISTTLPQIIMQQQDPANISPTTAALLSAAGASVSGHSTTNTISNQHSTISLSPIPTTITLSPIIVTSSNPFPSQIFSEEEIITTTQCSIASPSAMTPTLVEITTANDGNSNNTLSV